MSKNEDWLAAFHRLAKENETLIRDPENDPGIVLSEICDQHQTVMAMIPKRGTDEVTLLPVKGTDLIRNMMLSGKHPARGTYERITAIYARDEMEAKMFAAIFGDGGIDGPIDPEMRRMLTDHVASTSRWPQRAPSATEAGARAKRVEKNLRRAAAAAKSNRKEG